MSYDYEQLISHYEQLLLLLIKDKRAVSVEVIQIIRDDIEDIKIKQGKASQIQPSINNKTGFKYN